MYKQIIVDKIAKNKFRAYLEDQPRLWAAGRTANDDVLYLIERNPIIFEIKIEFPKT